MRKNFLAFTIFVAFGLVSTATLACYEQPGSEVDLQQRKQSCLIDYQGSWKREYNSRQNLNVYTCNGPGGIEFFRTVVGVVCDQERPAEPQTAVLPPDTPTTEQCGSVIRPESRVVEESILIAGTPFFLNYSSARAIGFSGFRSKLVPVYGLDCFEVTSCPNRKTVVTVGDRTFEYTTIPGIINYFDFVWDGLNAAGNLVLGSVPFRTEMVDVPGHPNEVPIGYSQTIGSFYSLAFGLGGWTISPVHYYDVNLKTVFRGDGSSYVGKARVFAGPSYMVPSEDGSEVYFFDLTGRHTQTKTGVKGTVKHTMTYVAGKLSTIADAFSNITRINYNGAGRPVSIVGPFGSTTTLTTDADGYIATVVNPNSEVHTMTYLTGTLAGLLDTFVKPNGVTTQLAYFGGYGRLTSDSSSAGSGVSLGISSNGLVQTTSNEGVVTEFSGGDLRITQGPGFYRAQEAYDRDSDGIVQRISGYDNTGTNFSDAKGSDPRFPGLYFTNNFSINSAGLLRRVTASRAATLSNPNDFFSVVDLTETYVLNSSKTTTLSYLASTSRYTVTSPVGRKNYVTIDAFERPVSMQLATYTPTTVSYDTRGRVSTISQGSNRRTTLAYNPNGYLQSITNPLGQVKRFSYDSVGRITQETLPDTRVIGYSYDINGNLASVTPPGGLPHTFLSNGFDLISRYAAPTISFLGIEVQAERVVSKAKNLYRESLGWLSDLISGFFPNVAKTIPSLSVGLNTEYAYDNDRKLTSITRPDGAVALFSYGGPAKQLTGVSTPVGNYSITQNAYYDRIDAITSPDGVTQTYTQVGSFLMDATNSGATSGAVYFTYNNDFQVASTKVNTAAPVAYAYDNDGLVTTVGDEIISRNAATGFATKATLGGASENYAYSTAFGELSSIQGRYSTSTNIYLSTYTRDRLGRVISKAEKIGAAATNTFAYTFDSSGRLTTVTRNGAPHASYVYSSNNNRTSTTRGGVTTLATFDEQDRIKTFGTKTYSHNDSGERTQISDSATMPASVTSFTYDFFGNLKSVTLPTGTLISYVLDGQNRRVGRKVGATLDKQFVWFDSLRPAAELNGTGAVVSEFIYGLKDNVPDYIIKGSVRYKVMTDHLGSVVAVVHSTNGTVAQRIEYDEFGRVLSDTSPGFQPFGFAGGLYDPDTKLTLFGARTYDAETGRWLSKDPILFGGGDTNLYGYVVNDPVNKTDPSGLCPWCIPAAIIGVGIGADYLMDPIMFVPKWESRYHEIKDLFVPPTPVPPRMNPRDWPSPDRDPTSPFFQQNPKPPTRNQC
jgi:RHS repeat-associated protein